jgi:hypothetical protein
VPLVVRFVTKVFKMVGWPKNVVKIKIKYIVVLTADTEYCVVLQLYILDESLCNKARCFRQNCV